METIPEDDRVPEPVRRILTLFQNELANVRFPNVDADALQRLVDEVRDAACAVTHAEEQLEATRVNLSHAEETLLQRSQQALSYAQIYAQDDASLRDRLQSIDLHQVARPNGKPGRKPVAKKRAKRSEAAEITETQAPAEGSAPHQSDNGQEGAEHAA